MTVSAPNSKRHRRPALRIRDVNMTLEALR